MPNMDLQVRAGALRKEIANLRQAISTIDSNDADRGEQLERLRSICALRERELQNVEAQLARRY
jgi:hypothetical protein